MIASSANHLCQYQFSCCLSTVLENQSFVIIFPAMKFFFAATIIILSIALPGKTQPIALSSAAEISVITCGPYQGELYSAFGHSAFRVYDPAQGIDEAYNYGVFDFDQPNFYLNFARGYLYYKLGVYPYPLFRDYYIYHNRYVHEQVLNLTTHQKQRLYNYLLWNAKPENETYRYDYFFNNCATKIRDVMVTVFGDSIIFKGNYIKTNYTIRNLTDLYLVYQPWGDLGIDICLGLPMDKKADPYTYMFLPDYIELGFDHAILNNQPVVKEKIGVYESRDEDFPKSLWHPLTVFIFFGVITLAISAWDFKRKKLSGWFDALLFGGVGLIGILLLLLWVATDHQAAAKNFNLLWALPTHVIAVIAFVKNPMWLKKYFLGVTILSALLLLTWPILPQNLNYMLIPVVVTLLMRSFTQFKFR
jgi:hypothetical protein